MLSPRKSVSKVSKKELSVLRKTINYQCEYKLWTIKKAVSSLKKNQNEDGEKLVRKYQHNKFAQTATTLTNVYIYFRFILMQNFTRRVE